MIEPKDAKRTVSGDQILIYNPNAGGKYSIHGAVWENQTYQWIMAVWDENGRCGQGGEYNLDLTDWRDNIPWNNIHPEIVTIIKNNQNLWKGFDKIPYIRNKCIDFDNLSPKIWIMYGFYIPNSPEPLEHELPFAIRPEYKRRNNYEK